MSMFRPCCKCLAILGVLLTSVLAENLSAAVEGIDILNRAQELLNNHRIEEARALLSEPRLGVIRKNNPVIDAAVINDLGLIFDRQGLFRDAERAYERAIGLLRHADGTESPALVSPLANLANLLYESSQFSRAETLLTEEITILDISAPGELDKRSVIARAALAKVYLSEHKYDLAAETAESVIKARDEVDEALRLSAAVGYSVLGSVSTHQGRLSAAEALFQEALSTLKISLGPNDVRISEAIANLGLFYVKYRDLGTAEPLLEDAYERLKSSQTNNSFREGFLVNYAQVENRSGHKKKARELLNEARSLAVRSPANVLSQYVVDASAYRQ